MSTVAAGAAGDEPEPRAEAANGFGIPRSVLAQFDRQRRVIGIDYSAMRRLRLDNQPFRHIGSVDEFFISEMRKLRAVHQWSPVPALWIRRRRWLRLRDIADSLLQNDPDAESLLAQFCEADLGLLGEPWIDNADGTRQYVDINRVRAYVAQTLTGMRFRHGTVVFRDDLSGLNDKPEFELYDLVQWNAKGRMKSDQSTASDRVRLTTGQTENGRPIRRHGLSLDAEDEETGLRLIDKIEDTLIQSPLEFLLESAAPMKLATLQEMVACGDLAPTSPITALKLTQAELDYARLRKLERLTKEEVQQELGWDDRQYETIRRTYNRKIQPVIN